MTPTQALAKMLEEAYRWMKTHAPGCHGLSDGAVEISDMIARLTAGRADLQADRERLEALEIWFKAERMRQMIYVQAEEGGMFWLSDLRNNLDFPGETLRQAIDAARKAGA